MSESGNVPIAGAAQPRKKLSAAVRHLRHTMMPLSCCSIGKPGRPLQPSTVAPSSPKKQTNKKNNEKPAFCCTKGSKLKGKDRQKEKRGKKRNDMENYQK